MRIDFIINSLGLFGAVRELIETGNALSRQGHDVTVWTRDGQPCTWLVQEFRTRTYADVTRATTDALLLLDLPDGEPLAFFDLCQAAVKTLVLTGFYPDRLALLLLTGAQNAEPVLAYDTPLPPAVANHLRRLLREYPICADGAWQLEFLRRYGVRTGVAIGGINPAQFYPETGERATPLLITGDPRPRKGTAVLRAALEGLEVAQYWVTKDQAELRRKLSAARVFLDNESVSGWCNPVLEAMACGCACVTSDVGGVHEFAIHEQTALLVPLNDIPALRAAALRLLADTDLRARLAQQGAAAAAAFTYDRRAAGLAEFLQGAL